MQEYTDILVQGAIVFAVTFLVTYLLVPVSKVFAWRMGAIDYPGQRRVQNHVIPRAGGIALFGGLLAGGLTLAIGATFFGWDASRLHLTGEINYVVLFIGFFIIFLVGIFDDISPMSARSKLAGQVVAAGVICFSGATVGEVRGIFSGEFISLGWFDYPVTVVYILIFMNVINLIDGLDGLAAGLVAIMACGLLLLVARRENYTMVMFCLMLVGMCVAFLRFNFYPASVFMGDSGSLLLGSVLAVISVLGVVRTQSLVVALVPLVIAGIPVMDTGSAIVRRIREGKSIGEADMEHVHHRLLNAGLSQRRSVGLLYVFSVVLAVVGYYMSVFSGPVRWVLLAVIAVALFVVIRILHLFDPVLEHYYQRKTKQEPRRRKVPPKGTT